MITGLMASLKVRYLAQLNVSLSVDTKNRAYPMPFCKENDSLNGQILHTGLAKAAGASPYGGGFDTHPGPSRILSRAIP
jgi:hypothetical protein